MATPEPATATAEQPSASLIDLDAEMERYGKLLQHIRSWPKLIQRACPAQGPFNETARDLFAFATARLKLYLLGTCEYLEQADAAVRQTGQAFLREAHLLTRSLVFADPRRAAYASTYNAENMHTYLEKRQTRFAYVREEEQSERFPQERGTGLTSARSLSPPSIATLHDWMGAQIGPVGTDPASYFARLIGATAKLVQEAVPTYAATGLFANDIPRMPVKYAIYIDQLEKVCKELELFWATRPAQDMRDLFRPHPKLDHLGDVRAEPRELLQFVREARPLVLRMASSTDVDDAGMVEIFSHNLAGSTSSLSLYVTSAYDELHRLDPALESYAHEDTAHPFPANESGARTFLVDLLKASAGDVARSFLPDLPASIIKEMERRAEGMALSFAVNPIDSTLGREHWVEPMDELEFKVGHYEHAYLGVIQAPVCYYYRDVRSFTHDTHDVVYSMLPRAEAAMPQAVRLAEAIYKARDAMVAEMALQRQKHHEALMRVERRSLASGTHLSGLSDEPELRRAMQEFLQSPTVLTYTRLTLADLTASRTLVTTRQFLHELPETHLARVLYERAFQPVRPTSVVTMPSSPSKLPASPGKVQTIPSPLKTPTGGRRLDQAKVAQTAAFVAFKPFNMGSIASQAEPLTAILRHWEDTKRRIQTYYIGGVSGTGQDEQIQPVLAADKTALANARARLADAQSRNLDSETVAGHMAEVFRLEADFASTTEERKRVVTKIKSGDNSRFDTLDQYLTRMLTISKDQPLQGLQERSFLLIWMTEFVKGELKHRGNWKFSEMNNQAVNWLRDLVTWAKGKKVMDYPLIAETSYALFLIAQLCRVNAEHENPKIVPHLEDLMEVSWGYYCIAYHRLSVGGGTESWAELPRSFLRVIPTLFMHVTGGARDGLPIDMEDPQVALFLADEVMIIASVAGYWLGKFDPRNWGIDFALGWASWGMFKTIDGLAEYTKHVVANKPAFRLFAKPESCVVENDGAYEVKCAGAVIEHVMPTEDFRGALLRAGPDGPPFARIPYEGDRIPIRYWNGASWTDYSDKKGFGLPQNGTFALPGGQMINSTELTKSVGTYGTEYSYNGTIFAAVKHNGQIYITEVGDGPRGQNAMRHEPDPVKFWTQTGTGVLSSIPDFLQDHATGVKVLATLTKYGQLAMHHWRGIKASDSNEALRAAFQRVRTIVPELDPTGTKRLSRLYFCDNYAPSSLLTSSSSTATSVWKKVKAVGGATLQKAAASISNQSLVSATAVAIQSAATNIPLSAAMADLVIVQVIMSLGQMFDLAFFSQGAEVTGKTWRGTMAAFGILLVVCSFFPGLGGV